MKAGEEATRKREKESDRVMSKGLRKKSLVEEKNHLRVFVTATKRIMTYL